MSPQLKRKGEKRGKGNSGPRERKEYDAPNQPIDVHGDPEFFP
jgi:hypothetical protein